MKLLKSTILITAFSFMSGCAVTSDILTAPQEANARCKLSEATPIAQHGLLPPTPISNEATQDA